MTESRFMRFDNAQLAHTEETKGGIKFRMWVLQDPHEPDFEPEVNATIRQRLNDGDVWAWASVQVEAIFDVFRGNDYLTGCNYQSTSDFIANSGQYEQMKDNALEELTGAVHSAWMAAGRAREVLQALDRAKAS